MATSFSAALLSSTACGHASSPVTEPAQMANAWSLELTGPGGEWSPTLVGEHLLLVGQRSDAEAREVSRSEVVIQRIHAATGSVQWERPLLAEPGAIEMAITDRVYVFRHGDVLEAVSPDGTYLWGLRYEAAAHAFGVGGGLLAVALSDGTVNVRAAGSGANRWTLDVGEWEVSRFVEGGGTIYGLATRSRADGSRELAAFDFGKPHNTPAWTVGYEGEPDALQVADGRVLGSLGFAFDVYDLATGDSLGDTPPAGADLVGPFVVTTERVDGLELRMHSVRVRRFDAEPDTGWTQAVASAMNFSTLQVVDRDAWLLAASGTVARLYEGDTGVAVWTAHRVAIDDDGRSCTVLGALPAVLIERCDGVAGRLVRAMEVVP